MTKPTYILTREQMEAIEIIMDTWSDDYSTRISKLKGYLARFREELENKGLVPEYLAYAISAQVDKAMIQWQEDQLKQAGNN